MEGKSFTVQEAARIMNCTPRNVRNLIAEGRLNGPLGGTKEDRRGRVSEKSLKKYLFVDRISRLPVKLLKDFKNRLKVLERFSGKTAEANCFFPIEGTDKAPESDPSPLPQREREHNKSKCCLNHEFAARHQFSFRWRARHLVPHDPSMQDDLVQEMSQAVLEYDKLADFDYLFELATNRAKNYLKYEAQRGMLSLDEARRVPDRYAEKRASLQRLIDELIECGVPVAWIEEVIGWRLDAA